MRTTAQQEKKNKREHKIPFNDKRLRILIAAVLATLHLVAIVVTVIKKPTPPTEPSETETANSTHIETETTEVLPVVTEEEGEETLRQDLDDKETTDLDYAEAQETINNKSEIYSAYKKTLMNLRKDFVLPTGEEVDTFDGFLVDGEETSTFCIADVDMDGVEELVIYWTDGCVAGYLGLIYQFDAATNKMKEELRGSPDITFYDNGVMQEPLSHNQGPGQKNWPYIIYEYNAASDSYEEKGSVGSWDKEYRSEDYPQDVDTSNYGTVFSIQYEGYGETYEDYFSKEVYDEFLNKLLKDAKEIKLDFIPLSFENIDRIAV